MHTPELMAKHITPWTRVLAAIFLGAVVIPLFGLFYEWTTGRVRISSWRGPWHETLLSMLGIGFVLAVVPHIVFIGRLPRYWERVEARLMKADNRPGSSIWRRSYGNFVPDWLFLAWILFVGGTVLSYAIIITLSESRPILLALVWCLAFGVLVTLTRWWRQAATRVPTEHTK